MATIEVTKVIEFEMAHALHNHKGLCKNVHGHTYKLEVTIKGAPKNTPSMTDDGMLVDFADFKEILQNEIKDRFDHALILNQLDPRTAMVESSPLFGRAMGYSFNPTCENLTIKIAEILTDFIRFNYNNEFYLTTIRLWETPTSFATWRTEDNPM